MDPAGIARRQPRRRLLVTALLVAVLVSPALRNHDSFPLSTYPIYASDRSRIATFGTAVGERDDGAERRLPMEVIARTDDPLIAADRLRDAIAAGRSEELCREIASRAPHDIVAVLVVTERHDVVETAGGDDAPLERTVHARCEVSQ